MSHILQKYFVKYFLVFSKFLDFRSLQFSRQIYNIVIATCMFLFNFEDRISKKAWKDPKSKG